MQMFKSATLKLTGWYLLLLMSISFIFSATIYQLNTYEVSTQLEKFQQGISGFELLSGLTPSADQLRLAQAKQASDATLLILLNVNIAVLIVGGLGSYVLARRTLRPLQEAHEAQTRFTGDASHELRTPLAAMKAELEVALRGGAISPKESKELLGSTLEEVDKLIELSEFLLKLARLDDDKLDKTAVELQSIASRCAKRFASQARKIDIIRRPKKVNVYANQAAIEEVMTILIDNALKHGNKKAPVMIEFFDRSIMAGFCVTNQGKTIPADVQHKLFDRFYKAERSRTNSSHDGYGLGLAIAKKIATVHHGDITVKSKNGKTTFTCSIPKRGARQRKA